MANSILQMIANPVTTDPAKSFDDAYMTARSRGLQDIALKTGMEDREYALQDRAYKIKEREAGEASKAKMLSAIQSGDQSTMDKGVQEYAVANPQAAEAITKVFAGMEEKSITQAVFSVLAAGGVSGDKQNVMLEQAQKAIPPNHHLAKPLQDLINTPAGKEKDEAIFGAIQLFRDMGILKPQGDAPKTKEMLETEAKLDERRVAVAEQGLDVERGNLDVRRQELTKPVPVDSVEMFVQRKAQQYKADTDKDMPDGMMADLSLQYKRQQAEEAGAVRLAEKTVDANTAQKIKQNEETGKMLAQIQNAPALAKAEGRVTDIEKKETAKTDMAQKLSSIAQMYLELDSQGAIVNVEKPTLNNIVAKISSSAPGQSVGGALGSDAQSLRAAINNTVPLLVQDIRKATDMGARGMDSEKELEFYKQAASNPNSDIQSNLSALYVLDMTYGNGDVASALKGLDPKLIKRIQDQGSNILKGGTKTEDKPKKEVIIKFDSKGNVIK